MNVEKKYFEENIKVSMSSTKKEESYDKLSNRDRGNHHKSLRTISDTLLFTSEDSEILIILKLMKLKGNEWEFNFYAIRIYIRCRLVQSGLSISRLVALIIKLDD